MLVEIDGISLEVKYPWLFKGLDVLQEAEQYRHYAAINDPPNIADWELYHPVCRVVWQQRGIRP